MVVGTDGSPSSLPALRWAALEAQRHAVGLTVLLAYNWRTLTTHLVDDQNVEDYVRDLAMSVVDAAVAEARTVAPRARVHGCAVFGEPAPVLLAAGDEADLAVVGSRGGDRLSDRPATSVTVQVAAGATCPVAVVVKGHAGDDAGPVVVGVDDSASSDVATGVAFQEAACRGCGLLAVFTEPESAPRDLVADWRDAYPDVPVGYAAGRGSPDSVLTWWSRRAQLMVVDGHEYASAPSRLIRHAHCPVLIARALSRCGALGRAP
jgi:nucleotide-binding universal stress UspA family protein